MKHQIRVLSAIVFSFFLIILLHEGRGYTRCCLVEDPNADFRIHLDGGLAALV